MNRRTLRVICAFTILAVTISAFTLYFVHHPAVRLQLQRTSPAILALIMLFYLGTILALTLINASTLRLCKVKVGLGEGLLLTTYTAVANFFGPLQSGPAVRAVYLKRKYGLNLRNYAVATFVYYFFYAGLSGLFLLSGVLKWWLVPLAVAGLILMLGLRKSRWLGPRLALLDLRGWYYLAAATFLQVSAVTLIYYTELHNIAPATTFGQAVVYTGAANFALFVSITPGAIGFRESFLVFSQHLHHISNSTIVAANIIDRALYLVLLLLMALFIFMTHARRQFKPVADKK